MESRIQIKIVLPALFLFLFPLPLLQERVVRTFSVGVPCLVLQLAVLHDVFFLQKRVSFLGANISISTPTPRCPVGITAPSVFHPQPGGIRQVNQPCHWLIKKKFINLD